MDHLFNKNAKREQMANLKGKVARERREAQLRAERKAAERRVCIPSNKISYIIYEIYIFVLLFIYCFYIKISHSFQVSSVSVKNIILYNSY